MGMSKYDLLSRFAENQYQVLKQLTTLSGKVVGEDLIDDLVCIGL
jgi:hypothetical protein